MSNVALDWAKRQRAGGSSRKAVLLVLADAANDAGTAWLSRRTIAEITELSLDTVSRALRGLQEAGLATRRARHRANGSETSSWWDLALTEAPSEHPRGGAACGGAPPAACPSPDPSLDPSVPSEQAPVGACFLDDDSGDLVMTSAPDPAQIGFDLGVDPVEEKPKAPRKDGGPASRVVAAYCRSYVEAWERQPASERGRVAGAAQQLLNQGHSEAELIEAAEAMGRTRFTNLGEELRLVRARTERVERAQVGAVEGWGGAGPVDDGKTWIYG